MKLIGTDQRFLIDPSRIDLILVKQFKGSSWVPVTAELLGTKEIEVLPSGTVYPSDHFGLFTELKQGSA